MEDIKIQIDKTLTVGDLKKILERFSDDTAIRVFSDYYSAEMDVDAITYDTSAVYGDKELVLE